MAFKKIHHTHKSRILWNWVGRIFMYFATSLVVIGSFLFFWFAYMIYKDGSVIGATAMATGALILFIAGILFIRMVTRIPREDYGIELKEDGIYQYFVNFDRQETKEHFISYDQIECIDWMMASTAISVPSAKRMPVGVRVSMATPAFTLMSPLMISSEPPTST